MSTQVVVTLPDEVYASARRLAELMSDADVVALTELQLPPEQDRRLSVLLHRQQAGRLTESERPELGTLMQAYREGLLRKAQALEEAVRRGLREPLGP